MARTPENYLRRLLVVDDDEDLRALYRTLFETHGFLVTTVRNGTEALQNILKSDVDVVICDLMMPEMSGDMFYLAVERVKPHLCERFIFITAYDGHPKFADFLQRTKALTLYKPVTLSKLLGTLAGLSERLEAKKKVRQDRGSQGFP